MLIALQAWPCGSDILEGIGKSYFRKSQYGRALFYFKKAEKYDKNLRHAHKWQTLIKTSYYWDYINQGEDIMAQGNFKEAQRLFYLAIGHQSDSSYVYNDLAELALLQKKSKKALHYFNIALDKDPLNSSALKGRLNLQVALYGKEKALQKGLSLPTNVQRVLQESFDEIELNILIQKLNALMQGRDFLNAQKAIDKLVKIADISPWVRSDIADALQVMGKASDADKLMRKGAKKSNARK